MTPPRSGLRHPYIESRNGIWTLRVRVPPDVQLRVAGPVLAWTAGRTPESLPMALSMLGLRVKAFDQEEREISASELLDQLNTFDALVDPPLAPCAVETGLALRGAKFIFEAGAIGGAQMRAAPSLRPRTMVLPPWSSAATTTGLARPAPGPPSIATGAPPQTSTNWRGKPGGRQRAQRQGTYARRPSRPLGPGAQSPLTPTCNELVYILSGKAHIRRTGDGVRQEGLALPGTSWIVPAGTHETQLELDGSTECLLIFLPDGLLDRCALADYDLDPDAVRLRYVGGMCDRQIAQIGANLAGLVGRPAQSADRMLADGLRTTLAAHLIGAYSNDRPERLLVGASLEPKRLARVVDYVESNLGEELALEDLASQACLSPYHFSRLFQVATGRSPHRYVTDRRVQAAQRRLSLGKETLSDIALDLGFGSQGNFTRVFRKAMGVTPGQFRKQR